MVEKVASQKGYDLVNVEITDGPDFSTKPVQFVLTERLDETVRKELLAGIEKIKFADLDMKVINCHERKCNFNHYSPILELSLLKGLITPYYTLLLYYPCL